MNACHCFVLSVRQEILTSVLAPSLGAHCAWALLHQTCTATAFETSGSLAWAPSVVCQLPDLGSLSHTWLPKPAIAAIASQWLTLLTLPPVWHRSPSSALLVFLPGGIEAPHQEPLCAEQFQLVPLLLHCNHVPEGFKTSSAVTKQGLEPAADCPSHIPLGCSQS